MEKQVPEEYIFFDERALRLYLKEHGRGSNSKDYELIVAIVLNRFFELQWKTKCRIGFKVRDKYLKLHPQGLSNTSVDGIRDVIQEQLKEDDVTDIFIAPRSILLTADNGVGFSFQLKRFGRFQEEKGTKGLISFLEAIRKKYPGTHKTILVLVLEMKEDLSLKEAEKYLQSIKFPFLKVMFVSLKKEEDHTIRIGEIWPNRGYNEYKPRDLIREMSELSSDQNDPD